MVRDSPSLGALLGLVLEYIRATAGATFTDEAVALRERIVALGDASARQLSVQLVGCLDDYVDTVVHGACAGNSEMLTRFTYDDCTVFVWYSRLSNKYLHIAHACNMLQ